MLLHVAVTGCALEWSFTLGPVGPMVMRGNKISIEFNHTLIRAAPVVLLVGSFCFEAFHLKLHNDPYISVTEGDYMQAIDNHIWSECIVPHCSEQIEFKSH